MKITRRSFLAAGLCAFPALAADNTPVDHVRALYAAHLRSIDGDARPLQSDEALWPKFFTPALARLWHKANLRTPQGESGPVDFDPFTASQDPQVKDLRLSLVEERAGRSATVLAIFQQQGAESRVAYTLLRREGDWRIDDVVPLVDGRPWSLRRALAGRPQRR